MNMCFFDAYPRFFFKSSTITEESISGKYISRTPGLDLYFEQSFVLYCNSIAILLYCILRNPLIEVSSAYEG